MKKRLIRLTIIITILSTGLYFNGGARRVFKSPTVEAVGDLFIDFRVPPGTPMFSIFDMAPGDNINTSIIVTNDATSNRPIGIKGIPTEETGAIASALQIIISQNGNNLYNNTLANFFSDSGGINGIPLSTLLPGQTKNYDIKVIFDQSSGDEFQAKKIIFDIQIGINIDVPQQCSTIALSGNPIFGTKNNDNLHGTPGNDLIIGYEGTDIIDGAGGNDCIIAGTGSDIVQGGTGNDVIFGNEGNDIINGGGGNDHIEGNEGCDILNGGPGNDIILGGLNIDIIQGGAGTDSCDAEVKKDCE